MVVIYIWENAKLRQVLVVFTGEKMSYFQAKSSNGEEYSNLSERAWVLGCWEPHDLSKFREDLRS